MYNYMNPYNRQADLDRINAQMNELEKIKAQMQQQPIQPNINQTFQLAPTNREVIRYASNIEEVQRDLVIGDTPYFSKDMSVVWIKNTKGEIKTYELTEIIPKDSKDVEIEYLKAQIEELKKGARRYESNDDEYIDATVEDTQSTSSKEVRRAKRN
jgi:hypothetical protein